MITITIKTDNAAFSEGMFESEAARILEAIKEDFLDYGKPKDSYKDINGNTVCNIKITKSLNNRR